MRSSDPVRILATAAGGAHLADQVTLAALPLVAVLVLQADAATVGTLVAAHAVAWLVLTLPGGLWVDRHGPRSVLGTAQAVAALAALAAFAAVASGSIAGLGAAVALSSAGIALSVLALVSGVRSGVAPARFASTNARLEGVRALATLCAPLVAAALVQRGAGAAAFLVAAVAAVLAGLAARRLPEAASTATRQPAARALGDGARFVVRHAVLRPIALCAALFNVGFFALIAAWVPYAVEVLALDAGGIGVAQAGYGAGMLAGAALAPRVIAAWPMRVVLVGGPAGGTAAALLLLAVPLPWAGFVAQFLVGFTPVIWLVCTITIRQRVVPPELLGRVGAVLQLALYGVRPLGAMAGGAIAHGAGAAAAMGFVAACFGLSAAVMVVARLRDAALADPPTVGWR